MALMILRAFTVDDLEHTIRETHQDILEIALRRQKTESTLPDANSGGDERASDRESTDVLPTSSVEYISLLSTSTSPDSRHHETGSLGADAAQGGDDESVRIAALRPAMPQVLGYPQSS